MTPPKRPAAATPQGATPVDRQSRLHGVRLEAALRAPPPLPLAGEGWGEGAGAAVFMGR
jgi:hypothetical protein